MKTQTKSSRIQEFASKQSSHSGRPISLLFGDSIDETVQKRICYTLKIFCAFFGYDFVESSDSSSVVVCYGYFPEKKSHIPLPVGYSARPLSTPAPPPNFTSCYGVQFPRFHPAMNDETDWLGEAFEWISTADEQAIVERDSSGRIPFLATLHGRYQLDPCVPYAALAFHCLREKIENSLKDSGIPDALGSSLTESPSCTIAATHDIDFLPVSSLRTAKRFLKNIAIAILAYRDLPLAASISLSGLRQLGSGPPVLDCLPSLFERERKRGIRSTCNVLCRQEHRRDADYRIDHPTTIAYLNRMSQAGVEIGLHGSYTSLDAPERLAEEYHRLSQTGYQARGGRQHWLRYQDTSLFEELRQVGAIYDCSVGYSDRIGFRSGACFAYPPYDFRAEAAFPLLELPLVIMDSSLYSESRNRESWPRQCQKVLEAVRLYGRGGVSILWHDTIFHGGQLPQELADLYWTLKEEDDRWTSALDLATATWPNYVKVGLLPDNLISQHGNRKTHESC